MRFYLDANLSYRIAAIVRAIDAEIDIVAAHDLGHDDWSDEKQLAFATSEQRCVVTRDYEDFSDLTDEYIRLGRAHAGVLLVPPSLDNRDFRGLAAAIVRYARDHPDDL